METEQRDWQRVKVIGSYEHEEDCLENFIDPELRSRRRRKVKYKRRANQADEGKKSHITSQGPLLF